MDDRTHTQFVRDRSSVLLVDESSRFGKLKIYKGKVWISNFPDLGLACFWHNRLNVQAFWRGSTKEFKLKTNL